MLTKLDSADRLRLMRFVCSFAWADLEVRAKERAFVRKMMSALQLDADEIAQVKGWLEVPPRAEEVDPATIPREHRQLFLDAARAMIVSDGEIDPHEHESLKLLEELLQ
jgi:tellurite resistance protein